MSILQQLFSILMAILIANPGCCCAFNTDLHGAENAAHSCCQTSDSDNKNDSEPNKQGNSQCHCADNPRELPSQAVDLCPAPVFILPEPTFAPEQPIAQASTPQLTMAQLALPPPPPLRVRYQIFQL